MRKGTVKWYNATKGFGYITPDDGRPDCFIHHTQVEPGNLPLVAGDAVEFESEEDQRGGCVATNVRKVSGP